MRQKLSALDNMTIFDNEQCYYCGKVFHRDDFKAHVKMAHKRGEKPTLTKKERFWKATTTFADKRAGRSGSKIAL